MKSILILDTSYTLKKFRELKMMNALESRELGGYFNKVISVHPLESLVDADVDLYGKYSLTKVSESHIYIGGKIGYSNYFRYISPINFLISQIILLIELVKICKKENVKVVRIGDPYLLGVMGFIISRIMNVPLVIRVGGRYDEIVKITGKPMMEKLFKYRWIEKIIEKYIFSKCNLIAGANIDNLEYATKNGGKGINNTIFRYGNLIDPAHWIKPIERKKPSEELTEINLNNKRFITVIARLEAVKRVDHVLKVIEDLNNQNLRIYGLIIGGGSLYDKLKLKAFNFGISDKVIFAGERSQEWISWVIPHSLAIVSPQMGRGLTEAALAEVPLVAYDFDWQKEIVIDGETGFLVQDNDIKALSDKVKYIFNNPDIGREMGVKARIKACEMMDPESLEKHEINEYSKLINSFYRK